MHALFELQSLGKLLFCHLESLKLRLAGKNHFWRALLHLDLLDFIGFLFFKIINFFESPKIFVCNLLFQKVNDKF